jgi:hypothetical protein
MVTKNRAVENICLLFVAKELGVANRQALVKKNQAVEKICLQPIIWWT